MLTKWRHFIQKHEDKKWYKHFDLPCSLASPSINAYVCNPKFVAQHAYYPFIHKTLVQRKAKKGVRGKIVLVEKLREIFFCSHKDRCIYQRYSFLLSQKYEKYLKKHSLAHVAIAYRSTGKNNIYYSKLAFDNIERYDKCLVFVSDFTSFFDNIDHKILKDNIRKIWFEDNNTKESLPEDIYSIYKQITRYSYINFEDIEPILTKNGIDKDERFYLRNLKFDSFKEQVRKNKHPYGIPQGSPISAVLSNIYLSEFDRNLHNIISNQINGMYMRYSDDILIVVPVKSIQEAQFFQQRILPYFDIHKHIAHINPQKTHSFYYSDHKFIDLNSNSRSHLDYLGFVFDGKSRYVRPKSIGKYLYKSRSKAISAGYQQSSRLLRKSNSGYKTAEKNIFPIRLYDGFSTCSKRLRSLNKYPGRNQNNYLTYLRAVEKSQAICGDKTAESILRHSKARIAKFIKVGRLKAIQKFNEKC